MSDSPHVLAKLRVIYGDTDQMGVVYYANYFRYFELSRSEYLRARGGSYTEFEKAGFGLPVVSAHCDYKRPAKYDDVLVVDVHLAELKRASMRFEYEVRRDDGDQAGSSPASSPGGTVLATGHTVHACIGPSGKPTGLPDFLLKLLRTTT